MASCPHLRPRRYLPGNRLSSQSSEGVTTEFGLPDSTSGKAVTASRRVPYSPSNCATARLSSCAPLHVTILHESSAEKSTVEARVVAGATALADSVVRSALGRCGVVCGASGAARTMRVRPEGAMSCLWSH